MFPTSRTAGGLSEMTRRKLKADIGMWLHREFPSCELMSLLLTWPVGMLLRSASLHLEAGSIAFADMPKRKSYIFVIPGLFLTLYLWYLL